MSLKNTPSQNSSDASESKRPNCPDAEGPCLVYNMAKGLGPEVQNISVRVIGDYDEDCRLTLRKNQDGFAIQVASAVKRGSGNEKDLDLASLHLLGRKQSQRQDL